MTDALGTLINEFQTELSDVVKQYSLIPDVVQNLLSKQVQSLCKGQDSHIYAPQNAHSSSDTSAQIVTSEDRFLASRNLWNGSLLLKIAADVSHRIDTVGVQPAIEHKAKKSESMQNRSKQTSITDPKPMDLTMLFDSLSSLEISSSSIDKTSKNAESSHADSPNSGPPTQVSEKILRVNGNGIWKEYITITESAINADQEPKAGEQVAAEQVDSETSSQTSSYSALHHRHLKEQDMVIHGLRPLWHTKKLAKCAFCLKPILRACFAQHVKLCYPLYENRRNVLGGPIPVGGMVEGAASGVSNPIRSNRNILDQVPKVSSNSSSNILSTINQQHQPVQQQPHTIKMKVHSTTPNQHSSTTPVPATTVQSSNTGDVNRYHHTAATIKKGTAPRTLLNKAGSGASAASHSSISQLPQLSPHSLPNVSSSQAALNRTQVPKPKTQASTNRSSAKKTPAAIPTHSSHSTNTVHGEPAWIYPSNAQQANQARQNGTNGLATQHSQQFLQQQQLLAHQHQIQNQHRSHFHNPQQLQAPQTMATNANSYFTPSTASSSSQYNPYPTNHISNANHNVNPVTRSAEEDIRIRRNEFIRRQNLQLTQQQQQPQYIQQQQIHGQMNQPQSSQLYRNYGSGNVSAISQNSQPHFQASPHLYQPQHIPSIPTSFDESDGSISFEQSQHKSPRQPPLLQHLSSPPTQHQLQKNTPPHPDAPPRLILTSSIGLNSSGGLLSPSKLSIHSPSSTRNPHPMSSSVHMQQQFHQLEEAYNIRNSDGDVPNPDFSSGNIVNTTITHNQLPLFNASSPATKTMYQSNSEVQSTANRKKRPLNPNASIYDPNQMIMMDPINNINDNNFESMYRDRSSSFDTAAPTNVKRPKLAGSISPHQLNLHCNNNANFNQQLQLRQHQKSPTILAPPAPGNAQSNLVMGFGPIQQQRYPQNQLQFSQQHTQQHYQSTNQSMGTKGRQGVSAHTKMSNASRNAQPYHIPMIPTLNDEEEDDIIKID